MHSGRKKARAFDEVHDIVHAEFQQSLANDYASVLAAELKKDSWKTELRGNRVLLPYASMKELVVRTIDDYIHKHGGYLTQEQFMALTGASESRLVDTFRPHHDTIVHRRYSRADIEIYSKKYHCRMIVKEFGNKVLKETEVNPSANVMNIYRKILELTAPRQGTLF
jgi:hypothetical protein